MKPYTGTHVCVWWTLPDGTVQYAFVEASSNRMYDPQRWQMALTDDEKALIESRRATRDVSVRCLDCGGLLTEHRADCPRHATRNSVAEIASRIRPALNIEADGLIRVSHGQDDIAETVVRLVLEAEQL